MKHRLGSTLFAALLAGTTLVATPVLAQTAPSGQPALNKVMTFDHQVTGITVSKDGRIFVNFPRWSEDARSRSPN